MVYTFVIAYTVVVTVDNVMVTYVTLHVIRAILCEVKYYHLGKTPESVCLSTECESYIV